MADSGKILAFSSIATGILLTLLGLASIGFYIFSVIENLDNTDRSVIFWYLIFVAMGITLVGAGVYFIWIGNRTRYEDVDTGLAKYSLAGLGTIVVVLLLSGIFSEWSADRTRSEWMKQEALQKSLEAEMHHIDRIVIDEFDPEGFTYWVHLSGGLEGRYRLKTSIGNSQALFLEKAEEITLDNSQTRVSCFLSFEQLFEKCFNEFRGSGIYVCIENTGSRSTFTLESQLILIEDGEQIIARLGDEVRLTSDGVIEFTIDTFANNHTIQVTGFHPIDR